MPSHDQSSNVRIASQHTVAALVRFASFASAAYEQCSIPAGSVLQKVIHADSTDTQATLYRLDPEKSFVLAFPGSQSSRDSATDADAGLCPYRVAGWSHCSSCRVHCGFLAAYTSVEEAVVEAIDSARRDHPDYSIKLVGHSLGGALAQLAYTSLARRGIEASEVFTYGQPRVGDSCFADLVDTVSGISNESPGIFHRTTHSFDGIPQVPAVSDGYRHSCTEYWQLGDYQSPSTFRCFGQEPDDCNLSMAWGFLNEAHGAYFGLSTEGDRNCS